MRNSLQSRTVGGGLKTQDQKMQDLKMRDKMHFQVFHPFWSPIFRSCIFSRPGSVKATDRLSDKIRLTDS